MLYEPNRKHKPAPQPGRRGSICPPLAPAEVDELLARSILFEGQRFASDGTQAYCGQCHEPNRDAWHGYPVLWAEVDPRVRRLLILAGQVEKRVVRRGIRARG